MTGAQELPDELLLGYLDRQIPTEDRPAPG